MAESPTSQSKVFISYSHRDKKYLDRLQEHLKPHVRAGSIPLWVDTNLKPGDDWKAEIERALAAAQVAILLVSVSFLASDFVAEEELPKLLAAAEGRGARILPVILTPCSFRRTKLSRFQAINDPTNPLSGLSQHQQDVIWEQVVEVVMEALETHTVLEKAPAQPLAQVEGPLSQKSVEAAVPIAQTKPTAQPASERERSGKDGYRFLVGTQGVNNKGKPIVKLLYVSPIQGDSDEAVIAAAQRLVDLSNYQNLHTLTRHEATKAHWKQVKAYFDVLGWNNHPMTRGWMERGFDPYAPEK